MRAVVALICFSAVASAAPDGQRYDGAHFSFTAPAGSKITDGTDVVAEHAVDVVVPGFAGRFQVLLGDGKASDGDVDSMAALWRDKRLRNRASWGVHASGEHRSDSVQVNGRRGVKLVDELQSTFGGTQTMICYATGGHLACAVGSGPPERGAEIANALSRMLASLRAK